MFEVVVIEHLPNARSLDLIGILPHGRSVFPSDLVLRCIGLGLLEHVDRIWMKFPAGPELVSERAVAESLLGPVRRVDDRNALCQPFPNFLLLNNGGRLVPLAFVDEELTLLHEPYIDLRALARLRTPDLSPNIDRAAFNRAHHVTDYQLE